MKRRITIKDKDKVITGEVNCRDYGIVRARQNNPSAIFRNKKKYTRKVKHKNKDYNY